MSLNRILHTFHHVFARHLLLVLIACSIPAPLAAQLRLPKISMSKSGATTSRRARDEAVAQIPFKNIHPQVAAQIRSVIDVPTIYRRLPPNTIECDPQLFIFLLRNPEVVVGIWDVMGATKIEMNRTGPFSFTATDGAGTSSDVQLVYGTQDLHIYFGEGLYEGTLLKKKIPGRAVLMLRSRYHQDAQGRELVTNVLDMFVEMDNVTVDAIAKTFRPVIGHYADLNFVETTKFVGRLSEAASRNPPAMQRMAGRLDKVSPPVREQFSIVAANVSGVPTRTQRSATERRGQSSMANPATDTVVPATANRIGTRDFDVQPIPNSVHPVALH